MQMDAEYFFPISPIRRPHIQQPIKASCLYLYQLGRNHIAEKTMAIEKYVNMHVSSMCVCERERGRAPGLKRARSILSGRFVAAITVTLTL